jgi:cytochrome d ubiquinol oxidase subunit I
MESVLLARIQFGMTIGFHFLFPPISIGLAWLLVWLEARASRPGAALDGSEAASALFGKLFAIVYVLGIASGVVMSLQFGTNWGRFSNFVSGVFGPILVAEVLIAFFLEAIFFGVWLFGRGRVGEGLRRASILLVAIGATISAFWIVAADSWMQTPAGYALSPDGSRALLSDFGAAVLNPSALPRYGHVMTAVATITGFIVAGVSAWLVLKGRGGAFARKVLSVGLVIALAGTALAIGSGIGEALRLGGEQPEKVSVFRGIGGPDQEPEIGPPIGPGADSVSAASIPPETVPYPPARPTKTAFWLMVSLALFFAAYTLVLVVLSLTKVIARSRFLLWSLVWLSPLPLVATESGWIAAEVGRQPWVVYGLLKTADSVSVSVSSGMLVFSLVLISLVYVLFFALGLGMATRAVRETPAIPDVAQPVEGGKA